MELVDLYRRSLREFTSRVHDVQPAQWSAPTPCTDWDVRTLVNHVVYEDRWTVPLCEGATIAEVGDRFDGDMLGADPAGNADEAAAQADAAFSAPGVLDRAVHLSFGDTPAQEYMQQMLADHLIHAWDLAAAIGADRQLDPEAVRACAQWFVEREDLYRQGGAIGARVEVPATASEQDQLLAKFGRDSAWPNRTP
jgi:uncharacterized protein (TIGR03086 family)